ncbi:MAG: TonB-dependent siderophore receptor [Pseudomonadota bacterium]
MHQHHANKNSLQPNNRNVKHKEKYFPPYTLTPLAFALTTTFINLSASVKAQSTEPYQEATGVTQQETPLAGIIVKATKESQIPTEKTGAYTIKKTKSATGLNLSIRETPQSVSVVTRAHMDDFRLNSVNDVLNSATGVVVEKGETDRTYYTARGFDITNFQSDGIGIPFAYGIMDGDLDTAIYDRVEVIRGATGLISGVGNPSATINFVRKRPTSQLTGNLGVTYGSWNDKRLDLDVSGPLNESKTLRGRFVAAWQDKDSYLNRYHHKKQVLYGVIDADVSDKTTLTLGHTLQSNKPKGSLWGALPLYFSDGTQTHYDTSTSTSPDWTSFNTQTDITFLEALHHFDNHWEAKAVLTRKKVSTRSKLFWAYGTPDRDTGLGVFSWPSRYDLDNTQTLFDIRANGPYTLGGRTHELMIGASAAKSKLHDQSLHGTTIDTPLPDLATWNGNYPEPEFTQDGGGSAFTDKQRSVYVATRINLADNFKLIVGANHTSISSSGESYGESHNKDESKTTPYIGGIFDINKNFSLYASYTSIFSPQSEIDANLQRLSPATGKNLELGAKFETLDKKLNGSIALFKTRQNNLATFADTVGLLSVYKGVDTHSQGFEVDASGAITPNLKLNAGYTQLFHIKDTEGNDTRTFSPRKVVRVSTTYRIPTLNQLKVGTSLNWQSGTYRNESGTIIRQPAYALVNVMARYDFTKALSATLDINNITNKKYLTSLYWDQGYYGAPRNASVSLNWAF